MSIVVRLKFTNLKSFYLISVKTVLLNLKSYQQIFDKYNCEPSQNFQYNN